MSSKQTGSFAISIALSRARSKRGHQDKVYIVLEGQGTFLVGTEQRVLDAGQGTLASAGEEHGVKNHTNHRLKVLVFMAPNPA
jgi:mannose-6-phosphate isomerase-like protein (cupin superfamily)